MKNKSIVSSDTLEIEELASVAIVRVHSLPELQKSAPIPIDLPAKTGHCSGDNPIVLCLRPREWLLISESVEPSGLLQHAGSMIDPERAAVNDNSDALTIFRISGNGTPWLLSKLSGLDYLAGAASGEHCARTRMGNIAVVVHYHEVEDGPFVFDLVFDRSYAKYLGDLLIASVPHADDLANSYG
jgi:heterotetrameric sarcosine oxidase gamma subunit